LGGTAPGRGQEPGFDSAFVTLASRDESKPGAHLLVDSNSTRTESCVGIRPDPKAQMRVGDLKAADHNG
jgi:hypothetical protein